jgi:hypothetical protein
MTDDRWKMSADGRLSPDAHFGTDSQCEGGKIRVHSRHSWPKGKKEATNIIFYHVALI